MSNTTYILPTVKRTLFLQPGFWQQSSVLVSEFGDIFIKVEESLLNLPSSDELKDCP